MSKRRRFELLGFTLAIACACMPSLGHAAGGTRPLDVADIFSIESLGNGFGGPAAYSEDGKQLAVTRLRPKSGRRDFIVDILDGNDLGDVWVRRSAGALINITRGAEDGSGWWAPRWSPDGRYLAMLSTRGAKSSGEVHLWVWDSNSEELRLLVQRVDPGLMVWESRLGSPYQWLDSENIVCAVMHSEVLLDMSQTHAQRVTQAAWPKAAKGSEVTASVLDSGKVSETSDLPGRLVRVNVVTASQTTVMNASTASWQVSPDRRLVAFARKVDKYTLQKGEVAFDGVKDRYTIDIARRDGSVVMSADGVARDFITGSLRWSRSGAKLAFLSHRPRRDEPPLLVVIDMAARTTSTVELGTLDLSRDEHSLLTQEAPIEWTADE